MNKVTENMACPYPENLDIQEKNFVSLVEPDTPIERTVTRM